MKYSSQRTRTSFELPDSVHRQLNMYALAAGAAGVSALSLAQPAEARIIYTPTHKVIGKNSSYLLALDHQTADFLITNSTCSNGSRCNSDRYAQLSIWGAGSRWAPASNSVVAINGDSYLVAALRPGARISNSRRFIRGRVMASQCVGFCASHTRTIGPWVNVSNRYLGLKFKINGKFHYGWARLSVKVLKGQFKITATLTGYAYETIPSKPIIAGATNGLDMVTAESNTEPVGLGRLALGRK
jgi:hypothetical protein